MYASIRRLGLFSFVLAVLNAIATVLLLFYFAEMHSFAAQFTWILYTATSALALLLLSWGLFSAANTLEQESSTNAEYMYKLNKRIKELEERVY